MIFMMISFGTMLRIGNFVPIASLSFFVFLPSSLWHHFEHLTNLHTTTCSCQPNNTFRSWKCLLCQIFQSRLTSKKRSKPQLLGLRLVQLFSLIQILFVVVNNIQGHFAMQSIAFTETNCSDSEVPPPILPNVVRTFMGNVGLSQTWLVKFFFFFKQNSTTTKEFWLWIYYFFNKLTFELFWWKLFWDRDMFAPYPNKQDGWFAIVLSFHNGTVINAMDPFLGNCSIPTEGIQSIMAKHPFLGSKIGSSNCTILFVLWFFFLFFCFFFWTFPLPLLWIQIRR